MTRRTSKRHSRKHYINPKNKGDYYIKDLKRLEEELHRKQENNEDEEEGDD